MWWIPTVQILSTSLHTLTASHSMSHTSRGKIPPDRYYRMNQGPKIFLSLILNKILILSICFIIRQILKYDDIVGNSIFPNSYTLLPISFLNGLTWHIILKGELVLVTQGA